MLVGRFYNTGPWYYNIEVLIIMPIVITDEFGRRRKLRIGWNGNWGLLGYGIYSE